MAERYLNLIGGDWKPARSGETFEDRNPARWSEVVGTFPRSGPQDVDAAVAAARTAYRGWRATPPPRRGEILLRAGLLLEQRKQDLARTMTLEMGKVLEEARGDVQEAIDMAFFAAGLGRRAFGETIPSELPDKACFTWREPVGVVGVITPWNFPVAVPSWKIFPALMAGNTIVFKPAEDTPLCGTRLAEVLLEAGLPAGVLNVVHGTGPEAGAALVAHPDVNCISFTGSTEVGKEIAAECGRSLKRVGLELGGKNAIVVMDDASLELAVDGAVWAAFGTTGQRCTAASRMIVQRGVAGDFVDSLKERALALRVGDGLQDGVQVGPIVNMQQLRRVHRYTQVAREEKATVLTGGEVLTEGELADGWFYPPTIFTDVQPDMRVAREEIFGPSTSVMVVDSLDQALEYANGTAYGLSLSLYTNDVRSAFRAMRELEAGIVYINAPTIGAEIQLPFGGVKQTGNGHREAGSTAMDEFTEWKSIYVDYSGRLQRAQIDTQV
ncbi:MAG: aldehyde dehydrogenase [Candidatus Nephthysia bennettiae]|uniref:Aldehyde dehydrogenase family protein n=1 Tax=Candidatus Nephthysia bennettiae TaxID=3127016 RepID=A0A934NEQ5_9BACT|nr:aldehyde dehydrogenase family protein [Candidatus Dormibacteraeota bacterium]MBJ7610980.1 aldehyde dehydrogenase family protein [Candidatus Dormibacteraeota bacterium]PZS00468.1 MAG: aldehyde dehydrogenase [Candidatus Dormibacteraeota bacterium]